MGLGGAKFFVVLNACYHECCTNNLDASLPFEIISQLSTDYFVYNIK